MSRCKYPGCGREARAHGYCAGHLASWYKRGRPESFTIERPNRKKSERKCSVSGCNREHFAKGFCRKDHARLVANAKAAKNIPCPAPGCSKKVRGGGFCKHHHARTRRGLPLNLPDIRGLIMTGPGNPRWAGGKSEYSDHALFKRTRLVVLAAHGHACFHCGDVATVAHHMDGSKSNHGPGNLRPLCNRCHHGIYHNTKRATKYRLKYSMSVFEIAELFGVSPACICTWEKAGILGQRIREKRAGMARKEKISP